MNAPHFMLRFPPRAARVIAALALPLTIGLTACGSEGSGAPEEAAAATPNEITFTPAQVQHGGVRWEPAVSAGTAATLEVPGQVVPNEDRTARLGAPARGRVVRVLVQPGQRVSRGQPLVTLQSQEASAARADYDKAVAELASRRAAATYARTARERAERLLAVKAIARQELERAQADDELARAGLTQAQAEVQRARSTLSQLGVQSPSGTTVVGAPLAGIVLTREAAPGAVVEAGAPLVTVTDPSSLWLDVNVADRTASLLTTGSRVRFFVPAFPSDTFDARVHSIGGALDPTTRTVPVRALVSNASGRLRPAMFATVWIAGGASRAVIAVPEGAVQMLDQKPVVFVAVPDGKGGARFERRDVQLDGTAAGRAQVTQGLTAGDVIVVAGAFAVKSEFSRSKMAKE